MRSSLLLGPAQGRTVIDRRDLPAVLGIGWGAEGTNAPFLSSGNTGLVLDLDNPSIGERHHLLVGMRLIDLLDLPASPTIAPAQGRALFGLWERGHIELFTSFEEFVTELNLRLSGAESAVSLSAIGSYDAGTTTLSAQRITVHLVED